METIDIKTTLGVAALVSVTFQFALKPILHSWLVKKNDQVATLLSTGEDVVSPYYGLIAWLALAILAIVWGCLGAVSGRTFSPDKAIDLAIGGLVIAVAGYELLKNIGGAGNTAVKSLVSRSKAILK